MSLGLPAHLAPRAVDRSLGKAGHAVALATLICASFVVLAFMTAYPNLLLWPALVAIGVMTLALWWRYRAHNLSSAIIYLIVGFIGSYCYILLFRLQLEELLSSSFAWLTLPKIAVILVGSVAIGPFRAWLWTTVGFLVAELAGLCVSLRLGLPFDIDPVAIGAYFMAIIIAGLGYLATVIAARAQPSIHRAAHDEMIDDIRSRLEFKASALMHDTILGHLAAISTSSSPQLSQVQKAQIERDLQILIGQEWLHDEELAVSFDAVDWRQSALNLAIQESKQLGLEVAGTGDFVAVTRLSRAQDAALGLAVKQCLVNVIKHSGVMQAEVAVYGSETEVSVMVIDAGKGFTDDAVKPDRLGLKASVHRRMESVGGTVQLWSTPGRGTSILIQVPNTETPGEHPVLAPGQDAAGDAAGGA